MNAVPPNPSPEATSPPAEAAAGYRVLARKYRPSTFDDLIGQQAMVRTLSNAFETGRIPQAWVLTGVRGVGKTTTARILARALNYELADGSVTGPQLAMPALGLHCQAIVESRHIDVIEMDAASHNGVEDVRALNDSIRYAPVSARYKVYILDEVHMLSTAAFNALLKTLEEPPPHAKFVFATTEIRKVPITILSRCQRFDLRRIDAAMMVSHLEGIAAKEAITADAESLALIARASEGSVRDALSLLDQAIAHAGGDLVAADVRRMLGLADRTRVIDLFDALMRGDAAAALNELRDQYDSGADPLIVLNDLAEFTHFVTRLKLVPSVAADVSIGETERTRGREFATALSVRVLSRAWQMLLKGIADVKEAPRPVLAAEMALVRIAHAADLPTPDEVVRALQEGGASSGSSSSRAAPARSVTSSAPVSMGAAPAQISTTQISTTQVSSAPTLMSAPVLRAEARPGPTLATAQARVMEPQPAPQPAAIPAAARYETFESLVALATEKRDLQVKAALHRDVRPVRCEDGFLEIALEPSAAPSLVNDLSRKFQQWTGRPWKVAVARDGGAPTLKSQLADRQAVLETGVRADPLVRALLDRFPGAEIVGVRGSDEVVMPPAAFANDGEAASVEDVALPDMASPDSALPDSASQEDVPPDDSFGGNWVRDDFDDEER